MGKKDLFSKIIIWMKKSFEIILGIEKLIHKIIEYPLQALNLTVSTAPFFPFSVFSGFLFIHVGKIWLRR